LPGLIIFDVNVIGYALPQQIVLRSHGIGKVNEAVGVFAMLHNPQAYEATVTGVPAAVAAVSRPRPDPDHPSGLAQRAHDG
jgi:hypothetical protein